MNQVDVEYWTYWWSCRWLFFFHIKFYNDKKNDEKKLNTKLYHTMIHYVQCSWKKCMQRRRTLFYHFFRYSLLHIATYVSRPFACLIRLVHMESTCAPVKSVTDIIDLTARALFRWKCIRIPTPFFENIQHFDLMRWVTAHDKYVHMKYMDSILLLTIHHMRSPIIWKRANICINLFLL